MDGAGLGALVALYETAKELRKRDGFAIRVTNPTPPVQQMIELARLVEARLERLEQQGVSGTVLHEEWQAIREANAPS